MAKEELGVMVMKGGMAWGIEYKDSYCTSYGWIDPRINPMSVKIANPEYYTKTTDFTYSGSSDVNELKKGRLVTVKRVTTLEFK